MIRTINALLHAVGLDASLIGTLLLSLSTIAGTEISNPSWVNFQSAGWVSFQSAPTIDRLSLVPHGFRATKSDVIRAAVAFLAAQGDEEVSKLLKDVQQK